MISYINKGKDAKTTIDYILMRQSERYMLQDAKIICGEECVKQHQLLVVDLRIKKGRKLSLFPN